MFDSEEPVVSRSTHPGDVLSDFSLPLAGSVKSLGSGQMGDVYLCRLPFKDGTRHRVAVKIIAKGSTNNSNSNNNNNNNNNNNSYNNQSMNGNDGYFDDSSGGTISSSVDGKGYYSDPADNQALKFARREMALHGSIRHPNVISLYRCTESRSHLYIFLEYARKSDLFNFLESKGALDESTASVMGWQLMSAIQAVHLAGVVHRDVKPENILLGSNYDVKLADFGMAAKIEAMEGDPISVTVGGDDAFLFMNHTPCGSPTYAAPEIFSGNKYGYEVDLWSLGVTIYVMIAGKSPWVFPGEKIRGPPQRSIKRIMAGEYAPLPQGTSRELADLVAGLLTVDPSRRMTIDMLMKHAWFRVALPEWAKGVLAEHQPEPEPRDPYKIDTEEMERLEKAEAARMQKQQQQQQQQQHQGGNENGSGSAVNAHRNTSSSSSIIPSGDNDECHAAERGADPLSSSSSSAKAGGGQSVVVGLPPLACRGMSTDSMSSASSDFSGLEPSDVVAARGSNYSSSVSKRDCSPVREVDEKLAAFEIGTSHDGSPKARLDRDDEGNHTVVHLPQISDI